MTKLHLSERDLQEAAEAPTALPAAQATHLRGCPLCQGRVATYQHLFAAAARMPDPAFGVDLAATVLAQLPKPKPAFPWALTLVAVLMLGLVSAFLALFGSELVPIFQSLSSGIGAGLAAVVGFVVAGQCLELLARHRRQMRMLDFS
ncbi:MAG TPA: hypothetical protein VF690_06285 [Hymenobacter sp.]|jgi:hypothetical protein